MFRRCSVLLLLSMTCSSFLFSQVRFTADFESGSLGSVTRLDSAWVKTSYGDSLLILSYDLFSRHDPLNPVDTSLKPSARWYYFKMEGVKGKQIFLNINNSEAIRPFYSYDGINFNRFEQSENINKDRVDKIFTRDTVYISHFIPYTLSHLHQKLDSWGNNKYVIRDTIGYSMQGRPIEMMTITNQAVDNNLKKRVWIHGRAHPSEQPCNWHLEAMIEKLLSGTPYPEALLSGIVFYIVPIINPDGVAGGYSRSTSNGVNIEINWDRPDSLTMDEVKVLKRQLAELTTSRPLDLLLNMHSQIANSITYWIHTAESTTPVTYRKQLLLSNLTANANPYYASKDQSFSDMASRYVEGWIWNKFNDSTVAITFETPYTYYGENIAGEWVSPANLSLLAGNSLNAIGDFLEINSPVRFLTDIEPAGRRYVKRAEKDDKKNCWKIIEDNSKVYFGDNMYQSVNGDPKARIYLKGVPAGIYTLYNWMAGAAEKISADGSNQWRRIGILKIRKGGRKVLKLRASQLNGVADKAMLVK